MKFLGLSRSLAHLKEELEYLGYEVLFEDEITSPVDAFIYSNEGDSDSLYSATQVLNTAIPLLSLGETSDSGILLIDGNNKSIDELLQIMNNRVYSPIL